MLPEEEEEDESTPLGKAEFTLKDERKNANVRVIKVSDGNYRLATPADEAEDVGKPANEKLVTETLISSSTTGNKGKIYIKGLDAGWYTLTETKAPSGYNLVPGFETAIEIIHDNEKGAYHVEVDEKPTNVVNIENNAGDKLPETGGIGTPIFYVVGFLLAAGAVAAFLIVRRKRILDGARPQSSANRSA